MTGVSTPNAASSGVSSESSASVSAAYNPVEFKPADIARRDVTRWHGLQMDAVEIVRREPYEYGARAPCHLLIMAERGERDDGETQVEGLPRSTLRNFSGRLSFVPRGYKFWGWQKPRVLTRVTYFCIDPSGPLLDPALRFAETEFKPRLYVHDSDLWAIGAKLKAQADAYGNDAMPGQRQYAEALSILLGHELLRFNGGVGRDAAQDAGRDTGYVRGGLAAWQHNRVAEYIAANLAAPVSLAALAEMVRLSPFHFSRAFKHSFGMPPHRYIASQRIAHAKTLLADDAVSVTEVGMALGFGDTSSFTAAFRRHTGVTPTAFRRGLD
jgi:AraC family transcriptional regulator